MEPPEQQSFSVNRVQRLPSRPSPALTLLRLQSVRTASNYPEVPCFVGMLDFGAQIDVRVESTGGQC